MPNSLTADACLVGELKKTAKEKNARKYTGLDDVAIVKTGGLLPFSILRSRNLIRQYLSRNQPKKCKCCFCSFRIEIVNLDYQLGSVRVKTTLLCFVMVRNFPYHAFIIYNLALSWQKNGSKYKKISTS